MPPDTSSWSLRPIAAPDAGAVKRLWRTRFGGSEDTQERWVEAALDPAHSATAAVVVSAAGDEVVAFGLLEIGDPAYTRRYLSLDPLGLSPPLASRNGIFHMYCVRRRWEGRGIGTALYRRHLRSLADREIPRAFGIAWHRPHTTDSRVLFEKYDFRRLATVERYYDRFGERPHCPDCNGDCTCPASLYARRVESG